MALENSEVDKINLPAELSSAQDKFLSLSKDELIDLVINLETEFEAREIAFNVLKLQFSKRDISLYYGCLEALQCDNFLTQCDENIEKFMSKEIKNLHENQRNSLQNIFSAKNKAQLVLKLQLQTLEERYQNVCQELSDERDNLLRYKKEIIRFREKYEKDNTHLREEFDKVSKERTELLDRMQTLEEKLEVTKSKCQLHKDGAMFLIRDRSWFAHKISSLVDVVNNLEISLEAKDAEFVQAKEELSMIKADYESNRALWSKSNDELNSELGRIVKEKDTEITSLREEINKLNKSSLQTIPSTRNFSNLKTYGSQIPLSNGMAKDTSRMQCDSIYDNVGQAIETRESYEIGISRVGYAIVSANNVEEKSLRLLQEANLDESSTRGSPFSDVGTIKKGNFVRPKVADDFSGFDIFGREMADLQELLVSMASSANDASNWNRSPGFDKTTKTDSSSLKPIDIKTLMLSIQTSISNGNASKLKEHLQQQGSHPQITQYKLPVGILPLHYAVECCSEVCVRVLLENGFNPNVQNEDRLSALHIASSEGSVECLKVLLDHGGSVSLANHIGMTPLHCAASSGHIDCCFLLLQSGARIDALNMNNWTPLHTCVFSGHSHCLKALLTFRTLDKVKDSAYETTINEIFNTADKDGCTLAYLACARETKDCLEVLARSCTLDPQRRDKWNRSILDVASPACLSFLFRSESTQEITCLVAVDVGWDLNLAQSLPNLSESPFSKSASTKQLNSTSFSSPNKAGFLSLKSDKRSCSIGSMTVSKTTNWAEVEEKLGTAFLNHVSEISIGLRTKKISRSEQESPDTPNPFTMGLTVKSIKYFSIGRYHWSPGTVTEKSPFEMLTTHNTSVISIKLFGLDNSSPDSLAYDSLIPIYVLQNYLRLVQQYKSVVFYGPKGMGKSYLVRKLALYIQVQETTSGLVSEISVNNLHPSFTSRDLIKLLISNGCLIDSKQLIPPATSPVLLFDDLTQVCVDEIFKEISLFIENRGPNNQFSFKNDAGKEIGYYMHPNCYIICTMDRPRSIGLELSIQQRFKWVQLRCDQEPSKYLLHRHLLRNLSDSHQGSIPLPDNSVYKAVEWLICVWQRLNDGIVKLGLLDLVFGPCYFLPCPIEKNKPKAILRWLISLWNQIIAPSISEAVIKSSGSVLPKESDGQQKVASTALYVLMQRAVVSGCPLAGQERDRYLACFHGSNELDIKVKGDRKDPVKSSYLDSPTLKHQFKFPESSASFGQSDRDVLKISSPFSSSSLTRPQAPRDSPVKPSTSNSKVTTSLQTSQLTNHT